MSCTNLNDDLSSLRIILLRAYRTAEELFESTGNEELEHLAEDLVCAINLIGLSMEDMVKAADA